MADVVCVPSLKWILISTMLRGVDLSFIVNKPCIINYWLLGFYDIINENTKYSHRHVRHLFCNSIFITFGMNSFLFLLNNMLYSSLLLSSMLKTHFLKFVYNSYIYFHHIDENTSFTANCTILLIFHINIWKITTLSSMRSVSYLNYCQTYTFKEWIIQGVNHSKSKSTQAHSFHVHSHMSVLIGINSHSSKINITIMI